MTTPTDLRLAATRLRELAEAATPGPWGHHECEPENASMARVLGQYELVFGERIGVAMLSGRRRVREADATFIATLSPPFALLVADWLDAEADLSESLNEYAVTQAEDVAAHILGGDR